MSELKQKLIDGTVTNQELILKILAECPSAININSGNVFLQIPGEELDAALAKVCPSAGLD